MSAPYWSREYLLRLMTSRPDATWRWDVDLSLDAAVRAARVTQLAGVTATLYVAVKSEEYNPFSATASNQLLLIQDLYKQRLGLHAHVWGAGDVTAQVRDQHELWGAAYPPLGYVGRGGPPVSFHMPDHYVLWRDFAGFDNAYGSRWRDRYVSDARHDWTPEKERKVLETDGPVQVCLHPEHWDL